MPRVRAALAMLPCGLLDRGDDLLALVLGQALCSERPLSAEIRGAAAGGAATAPEGWPWRRPKSRSAGEHDRAPGSWRAR